MSGFAGEDVASSMLDERMYFVGKPFRLSEPQHVLERALEQAR